MWGDGTTLPSLQACSACCLPDAGWLLAGWLVVLDSSASLVAPLMATQWAHLPILAS